MKRRLVTLMLTLAAMLMCIFGLSACNYQVSQPQEEVNNKIRVELTKENVETYIDVCGEIDGNQVHLVPSRFQIYFFMYINPTIKAIAKPMEEGYVCKDVEISVQVNYLCYRWNESDLSVNYEQSKSEEFVIRLDETGNGSVQVVSKKNSYAQQCYITSAAVSVRSVKGSIWVDCVHEWDGGTTTTPATCTETGIKTIKCNKCEKTKEESLPSLGHDYPEEGTLVSEPTCIASGMKEYVCARCNEKRNEKINALGHNYPEVGTIVSEPTCLTTGVKSFTCSRCEETKEETIGALGHSWGLDWSKDDTYHWIECSNCEVKKDNNIHNYTNNSCSVCGQKDNSSQGLEYKLSDCGTYYVLWNVGDCNDTNVIIASSYNGKPVKTISESAFYENVDMKSVTIPQSVTKIESWAFYGCSSLTSVTLSDNVTIIGESAFQNCGLKEITIGKGVISIEKNAFKNCSALISIDIPNSVTSIGESAFSACSSLTEMTVPFVGATKDGEKNKHFGYFFGASFDSYNNSYVPTSLKKVTVNSGTIGTQAFFQCDSLTSIIIGDSVTAIGVRAFFSCDSLTSVIIGNKVTTIGLETFSYCSALTNVAISDNVTSIGERAFYACSNLTSVTIGNSVTSIGEQAFCGCSSLKNLIIPNSVTMIGEEAFYGCNALTRIVIPDNVTSIGDKAFGSCLGLESIEVGVKNSNYASEGGILYNKDKSKILQVPLAVKTVVIPDSVTSIEEGVFNGCSNLTEITLPFVGTWKSSTIDTDRYPFGYIFGKSSYTGGYEVEQCHYGNFKAIYYIPTSLKKVTIKGGIIGNYAFQNCSSLTEIIIPDNVSTIGNYAFQNCSSLTEIIIPDNVSTIGNHAFKNCSSLTEIVIPNSVTSIGQEAFSCSGLTSVIIPESVISMGDFVFSGCVNLESIVVEETNSLYASQDGILYNKAKTEFISIPIKITGVVTIPNGITVIDIHHFSDRVSMTSVVIPDSVTSIGNYAFADCYNLMSVTIGNGVTSIGSYAFENCSSLTEIVIPDSVTSIEYYAFQNCTNLINAVIGNGVQSIGIGTFKGCNNLTEMTLPFVGASESATDSQAVFGYIFGYKSVESGSVDGAIHQYTYSKYGYTYDYWYYIPNSLKKVTITKSISALGFKNCDILTNITIKDSVTFIGSNAFGGCKRIIINCEATSKPSGWNSYWNIGLPVIWDCRNNEVAENGYIYTTIDGIRYALKDNEAMLMVQQGDISTATIPMNITYKNTAYSVTSIGNYAFYNCDSLTSVVIPDSVTSIGYEAFRGCSSLTSIEIPDSVTSIGDWAFYYCGSLTSIEIPDSVTSIGYGAFSDCSKLNYNVRNALKYLGNKKHPYLYLADTNSTEITTATIENGCKIIGYEAFYNCDSLTSVVIPDSVTSIGNYAFYNCSSLTEIVIPDSVTSIGYKAFYNCSSLTSVIIGNGVTSIGNYAFYNCSSLTSITIPDSVTSIGDWAFYNCSSLTSITIPDSVTSIGDWAFYNCSSLTSVYYKGTPEDWRRNISIGTYNTYLTNATRYYYSETAPALNANSTAYDGNYWHYDENGNIVVWVYTKPEE